MAKAMVVKKTRTHEKQGIAERLIPLYEAMADNAYQLMKMYERNGDELRRAQYSAQWLDRLSVLHVLKDEDYLNMLCVIYMNIGKKDDIA